jgi:hypothetical protein
MITILRIRIQTVNGENITRQQTVDNCHTFATRKEMEEWRRLKEMKLQFRETQRYLSTNPVDLDHCPKVYVTLDYKEPVCP